MDPFKLAITLLLSASALIASAQAPQPTPIETAKIYFAEAQSLCQADNGQLWGISLCGPIMLVDPSTRLIVTNQADEKGQLKTQDGAFVGSLPKDQLMSNTATEWSGVLWTQMLWPLPSARQDRETLIAHELFHRIQGRLNLPKISATENSQLDTFGGRYYLQLEWRALTRALNAPTGPERQKAAEDAILFRATRYSIFPDAPVKEQALELNEGLAEYTGVRVGNPPEQQVAAALKDISSHVADPTFVRSFAYATGPAYGLLLDRYRPTWHKDLDSLSGFDVLLRTALHFTLPSNLGQAAELRAAQYDGPALRVAEMERETRRQQVLALYRARFVEGPVLTLPFRNMRIQFDPRNLQPLDALGTVYPTMHISDEWGILDVKTGALLKADWTAVIVTAPSDPSGATLTGDGWTLELKPGWKIIPGPRKGDFTLASGS